MTSRDSVNCCVCAYTLHFQGSICKPKTFERLTRLNIVSYLKFSVVLKPPKPLDTQG